jgi:uncharacterized protein (DUF2062 family)
MMKKYSERRTQYRQRNKLSRWLFKAYERFVKIRGDPREIALGFALGIFIGMTPTLGFQIAIAAFLAALLRWSKIPAAMGVWISNPATAPFVYGTTYLVGAKVLKLFTRESLPMRFTLSEMPEMFSKAPKIFFALTIGGILLGLPLAVASYYLSYAVIRKYQEKLKEKVVKRVKKIQQFKALKRQRRKKT